MSRVAFTRTYLQGQEVREVARELGLTLSGVYKARDRVRRLLEEEGRAESTPSVGNSDIAQLRSDRPKRARSTKLFKLLSQV